MSKPGVIFVNPSLAQGGGKCDEVLFPFAAIMLLATILDRSGYDTTIIDGNMYPLAECIEKVRAAVNENTVFVGFSVMTSQVKWAYKVADALKKSHPALKIVWGGVHATLYPEQTIADPLIDIIAVNEACSSIAMLSEALKNGGDLSQVPGIYFRKDGKVIKNAPYMPDDITKIPQIDFSLFDAPRYARNNLLPKAYDLPLKDAVMMPIITGLGCAYKCSFCINVILNRKYRYMEAEDIVDRIEYLQKEYGANFFQLLDEDFFINKKRTMDFIELVEKRGLKFYFRPWMRVSYFRDSYISE
ncbi:MAG: cobalamin-dependent protein, partial [Dehalococcoidales bacterium]